MPLVGARRGENPFELKRSHHIGVFVISVLHPQGRVGQTTPRRKHNGADIDGQFFFQHLVIDRLCQAGIHAQETFTAHPAVQAAPGLGFGFRLGETVLHFIEVRNPLGNAGLCRMATGVHGFAFGVQIHHGHIHFPALMQVNPLQKACDGNGRLPPRTNGFHHGGRPGDHVPAGEDSRHAGGKRYRIDVKGSPPGNFPSLFFRQK